MGSDCSRTGQVSGEFDMKGLFRQIGKLLLHILKLPYFAYQDLRSLWYVFEILWHSDTFYFVCPYGIGDTLYLASFMDAFKNQYGIPRVALIVKKSHREIPGMFPAVDETVVSNDRVKYLSLFANRYRKFAFRNFRYGHFILQMGWPGPGWMLGVKGVSLLDVYRRTVLNLPMDCEP